ncbi:hypothetical protein GYMLUDRAFT_579117 [Collybiopsis luxurians FD-317 M1]|uniref:DUF7330 domain-containing protein n=1 Tax=Collybiopsis luxurians FD-317 M1 TaxID=944289 RepID=A0A0D0CQH5_9AGAR|nr:hypothetical protein GYMLUDRAFT_579117 [Collybiopsis luxurians FD-317 M1]
MSDAVSAQAAVFNDVQGTKHIYVGDYNARDHKRADDSIAVESKHGNVSICFEDEDPELPEVQRPGMIKAF